MRISGCVIARNEEANIANCIRNLQQVTDEIIVVDTGSEDNTIQIAEELGAFVYRHQWENDFSKAKNIALEHASGDWIIFLDADEYFQEDSLPKVRPTIQNLDQDRNIECIQCELVNIDPDKNKIISYDYILRIFRNKKRIRFVNRIHEEIRNNNKALKSVNMREELSIIHTGYSSSNYKKKAERNLELILKNMDDDKSLYYLATTYFALKDYENAYKYADLALSEYEIYSTDYLAYKMHLLKIAITVDFEFEDKSKIAKLIDEVNKKYGSHPEIAKVEAVYLNKEKYYERALQKFLYALECNEKHGKKLAQNDFPGGILEVYNSLAEILCFMNKEADALSYYVKILKTHKYHLDVFSKMLDLCRTIPEMETIAFINSIYDLESEKDVQFIVTQVAACGRPKVVLYYASRWNNFFGREDDVLIYAFISQGNYKNALEIALLYLENDRDVYSPLVTAILLMGQLYPEAEKLKERIGKEFYDIVSSCAGNRKYAGDSKAYTAVLAILEKHLDRYDITDYLKAGSELGSGTAWEIAEIFLKDARFEQAAAHFDELYVREENEEKKALAAFKSGYSFYKLKRFGESVDRLEKAAQNGYRENDLDQFLRWIAGQTPEEWIKGKAKDIQKML